MKRDRLVLIMNEQTLTIRAECGISGGDRRRFSATALEALCHYDWPGNVRELENVIRQLVTLTDAETIELKDLAIRPGPVAAGFRGTSLRQAKARAIAQFEKAATGPGRIARSITATSRARRAPQKERRAFGRLVKKYQLPTR